MPNGLKIESSYDISIAGVEYDEEDDEKSTSSEANIDYKEVEYVDKALDHLNFFPK